MRKFKIYFLILFLMSGCGKHAVQFQAEPVRQDFGTLLADKTLTFAKKNKPLHTGSYSQNQKITISSSKLLDLSDELLESTNPVLIQMGHNLVRTFYNFSSSTTQMTGMTNPPGSPYAEAASVIAQPLMIKKYDEAVTHVENMIVDIADHMSISVKELGPNPPSGQLIEKVIIGLKMFEGQLLDSRDGNGDAIIEKIATSVDNKYVKDLQDLQKSASLNPQIPLSQSLRNLKISLTKLAEISEFDRARLLLQVRYALGLATQNEQIKSSDDMLEFLVDFWLAKDLRKEYPDSIKKIFENLSESQIMALATENQSALIEGSSWETLKRQQDYNSLSEREIAALYLSNNGRVLGLSDWDKLKADQKTKLDALLMNDKTASLFANTIAVNPSDNLDDQRYSLIVNWLGLSGRLSFPEELRSVFSTLNEEELDLLGHNASALLVIRGHLELSAIRYKILSALDDRRIMTIQKLFRDTITSCTRERVNKAMMPVAESLSSQIKGALVPLLEKNRKDESLFATESYRDYGRYYLGKYIFGVYGIQKGDETSEASDNSVLKNQGLPLIEFSELDFNYDRGKWRDEGSSNFSGAKVLGQGLVTLSSRLETLPGLEGEYNSMIAIDLSYEAINKMLAIAGYRDSQNHLIDSLSVSMTSGQENTLFDIRNYNPTANVFAVPDMIKITDSFKLAPISRISPTVSLDGQMQLLRGYSRMLKFFKPWVPSHFDVGLGSITLEEDPTIKPFDRSDYFLLSLGLASTLLQNIPAKMLGIITRDNHYVDTTQVKDWSQFDTASAVMTDFDRHSLSHQAKTESLALAIMALSDFYEQIKDIERSTEPIIVANLKQTPIEVSRANIQKLISGLVLFSTSHLMAKDGGFYSSYDLIKMKVGSPIRELSDQLLMEEALLTASKTLDSGFMAARAIDNFFFLNNTLWDSELGFYRKSEVVGKPTVSLLDVARAFKNVKEMDQLLTRSPNNISLQSQNSVSQMEKLLQFWTLRFFTPEIQQLSSIDQVQDFSL